MDNSSKEQNYWPGFVDALSNVVLTLVFVLVVLVFALVIMSNKVEKRAAEMVREAHEKASQGSSVQSLEKITKELEKTKSELKELQEKEKQKQEEETRLQQEKQIKVDVEDDKESIRAVGAVSVGVEKGKIVIVFPPAISDLDPASLAKLDVLIEDIRNKGPDAKIQIHSYIGLEAYTAARRLAYYRILGLRNHLLGTLKMKGSSVTTNVIQPKEIQNGRVEIFFN